MTWLVTHMWMSLAAVAVLGLVFGWALRGAMMLGKMRRAVVERDVLQTELEQQKSENEELWAAQRSGATAAAGAGDAALKTELEARERRMAELSEELSNSKAELDKIRQDKTRAPEAPPVAVPAPARLDENLDHEEASLVWRNRHLESRVRHLEGKVHELGAAGAEADTANAVSADVEGAEAPSDANTAEHDKLVWQADYLKQRVAFLESQMNADPVASDDVSAPSVPADADEEDDGTVQEELASLRWRNRYLEGRLAYYEGDTDSQTAVEAIVDELREPSEAQIAEANDSIMRDIAPSEIEDEVDEASKGEFAAAVAAVGAAVAAGAASLEAGEIMPQPAPDEDDEDEEVPEEASSAVDDTVVEKRSGDEVAADPEDAPAEADIQAEADSAPDDIVSATEEKVEPADADAPSIESDADGEVEGETEEVTDEAPVEPMEAAVATETVAVQDEVLPETARVKPLALEGPVAGQGDNLTDIGGVGPKIQEVLNDLGVYHFDQIAAWSPENVAWVDDHLSFSGRIARERWVEQAQVLVGDTE